MGADMMRNNSAAISKTSSDLVKGGVEGLTGKLGMVWQGQKVG
jgi:hypothetical protein